jgi:hypothetical protein
MATKRTRLFMKGNSQRPKKISWAPLMDSLKKFTADFIEHGRRQPTVQNRKRLFT